MIDEWNQARTGWARFSDDRRHRFRLARALTYRASKHALDYGAGLSRCSCNECARDVRDGVGTIKRVTFVMLNPSTADAFKPDPTVSRCAEFARLWGADVLEVANLYSLISPHPTDLYGTSLAAIAQAADENREQLLEACRGATRVIAAWGNHGHDERIGARGDIYGEALERDGVELYHLGLTKIGAPIHPSARGVHRVPYDRAPIRWRECA